MEPIPSSARDAIAANDRLRFEGAGDAGLLTLADGLPVPTFRPEEVAMLVPRRWTETFPSKVLPSADAALRRFAGRFPSVVDALVRLNSRLAPDVRVVAAGGAAACAITDFVPDDVDLFLCGPGLAEPGARWRALAAVAAELRNLAAPPRWESLQCGVATFLFPWGNLQVILRAYPALGEILHGFDLPSCAVAFDGSAFFLTAAAAFAHAFHLNPVVPAYRSTTYEARLIKYFGRGFGLAFLDLAPGALEGATPGRLSLPHLEIVSRHQLWARCFEGEASAPRAPSSDYAPRRERAVASLPHRAFRAALCAVREGRASLDGCLLDGARLDFEAFVARGPPTLPELCPDHEFGREIHALASECIYSGAVRLSRLRLLGATPDEAADLMRALAANRWWGRRAARRQLAALADRRQAAFRELRPELEWWFVAKPGRQFTSSFNPCMEDPAEWYGAFAAAPSALPKGGGAAGGGAAAGPPEQVAPGSL